MAMLRVMGAHRGAWSVHVCVCMLGEGWAEVSKGGGGGVAWE